MNAPAIRFSHHAAKRILRRRIDAAGLSERLREAVVAGLIKPGTEVRKIQFGKILVVCSGLLVVTVVHRRPKKTTLIKRGYRRAEAKREVAWSE